MEISHFFLVSRHSIKERILFLSVIVLLGLSFMQVKVYASISNIEVRNSLFTGRKNELIALKNILNSSKIVALYGLSGIGKSQISKEFCYLHEQKYDLIWWFHGEEEIDHSLSKLLEHLHLLERSAYYKPSTRERLLEAFQGKIGKFKKPILLIFDNFHDIINLEVYMRYFKNKKNNLHIIITSTKELGMNNPVKIEKFNRNESIEFLKKFMPSTLDATLDNLAQALDDFPLALAQAVGYMRTNPSINVEIYLDLLNKNRSALWESEKKSTETNQAIESPLDHYKNSLPAALKMNLDFIKTKSQFAYELLCFSSYLSVREIPLEALKEWASSRRHVSEVEFHEALSLLINSFLLEKGDKENFYDQHGLIQTFIRENLTEKEKQDYIYAAAECLLRCLAHFPGTLQEQFSGRDYYYNHLQNVCDLAKKQGYESNHIVEAEIAAAFYIHNNLRDFDRSQILLAELDKKIDKGYKVSPLARIWLYDSIANYEIYGDFQKARTYIDKALENLKEIQDEETKNDYNTIINIDLMECLINVGQIKEAVTICDNLTQILSKITSKPLKIGYYVTSSYARLRYGQIAEGMEEINRGLALIKETGERKDLEPLFKLNKGRGLLLSEKYEECVKSIDDCYNEILKLFPSPDSFIPNEPLIIKAEALVNLGKVDEAEEICQKVLRSYEKTVGEENNSSKADIRRIIGQIYEKKGQHKKAFDEYIEAEKLYQSILRDMNTHEVGLLYMHLAILGEKLKDDFITKKYFHLLLDHFGKENSKTQEVIHYLESKKLQVPWAKL